MSIATSVLIIALLVVTAVLLGRNLMRTPRPADAWRIAGSRAMSQPAQDFYLDYIGRHTAFRRAGAIGLGALCAAGAWISGHSLMVWGNPTEMRSTSWCDAAGCVTDARWETTGTMAGSLIPSMVLGAIIGGLMAETYRLASTPGVRRASLDERPPRPLPRQAAAAWLMAALAVVGGVTTRLVTGSPMLLVGLVPGLLAVGLAEAVQLSLAARRRPVLTPEAMAVDRNLRRAIAESVTWMQLGAATLCLGWTAMTMSNFGTMPLVPAWAQACAGIALIAGFLSVIPALVFVQRSSLVQPGPKLPADDHLAVTRWFRPPDVTTPSVATTEAAS